MQTRSGFALRDLLVSVVMLAFAVLLFALAVQRRRERQAHSQTQNNLRILALAHHSFHDMCKRLPPAEGGAVKIYGTFHSTNATNIFLVGPFMEMNADALINPEDYSLVDMRNSSWTSGKCYTSFASNLYVVSDPILGITGTNAPLSLAEVHDGASTTIMLATTMARCGEGNHIYIQNSIVKPFFGASQRAGWQDAPVPHECRASTGAMAVGYSPRMIDIAMCDAGCKRLVWIESLWGAMLTPQGGEFFLWD